MATRFEGWLVGTDVTHLRAVSNIVCEEILRLEQLMSRHDPRAELARLNREAFQQACKVEPELFDILEECVSAWKKTGGYFDISFASHLPQKAPLPDLLSLNQRNRTIRFRAPGLQLDLGAYGKGYALDAAAEIIRSFGIQSAFLRGGYSSALAMGCQANAAPWQVRLADAPDQMLAIQAEGFSYSGAFAPTAATSDLHNPHQATPIQDAGACAVWAPTAAQAEIYSTALLTMGSDRAQAMISQLPAGLRVQLIQSQVL